MLSPAPPSQRTVSCGSKPALPLHTYALYHLPLEAVLYAAAVCAFFGAVFLTLDYLRFSKKHQRLQIALKEASVTIERLPTASSLPEEVGPRRQELRKDCSRSSSTWK